MPTQKAGYFLKDGTRVPGVTTVLSRFKEAGGLVHWAWKLGTEGKDYRKVRDDAAQAGTIAHEAVEKFWKRGESYEFPVGEVGDKAFRAFQAFREWADQTQLVVAETELPLISEEHKFGGTFDAILVRGKRAMGDWKTSNRIYQEHLVQLAAYRILWEENFPDKPLDGGNHLLRFDKEFGDFTHHFWADLGRARRAFLLMRELYDIDQELKRRV